MKVFAAIIILVGVSNAALVKRAAQQIPGVWDALAQLKGSSHRELSVDQIQELFVTAKAGEDFPILSEIPASNINCESDFKQPGFYADESSKCQVFHRCDVNHNLTHFLCPNMTLFNQITLVCDWWYNVDCSQAKSFQDYSNVRLYQGADVPLLDNQDVAASTGAVAVVSVGSSKKKGSKKSKRAAAQIPGVWDALAQLKGSSHRELSVDQIQELFVTAKAGEDFPILSEIPASNINCESDFKQPGFYADESSKCQVFHRCDVNHNLTHFLCPNMTLFNQITLICDWWYNVDCSQAKSFQDYSNVRLYQGADVPLLDNQDVAASTGAVAVVSGGSKGNKGKGKGKKNSV